jgi:hypothetical protein
MTTFMDLMGLARRTLARGEAELAGQISVLALDTFGDKLLDDDQDIDPQTDADQDQLEEKPLLEALEDGTDGYGAADMGQHGEVPIATVLEMSALAKRLLGSGYSEQAHALNDVIKQLSRGAA